MIHDLRLTTFPLQNEPLATCARRTLPACATGSGRPTYDSRTCGFTPAPGRLLPEIPKSLEITKRTCRDNAKCQPSCLEQQHRRDFGSPFEQPMHRHGHYSGCLTARPHVSRSNNSGTSSCNRNSALPWALVSGRASNKGFPRVTGSLSWDSGPF